MRFWVYLSVLTLSIIGLSTTNLFGQVDKYNCNTYIPQTNDDCIDAFVLSGATEEGITCCATIGQIDLCGGMETSIWYVYDQSLEGTVLDFNNIDISGPIGIEVYAGDCDNLTLLDRSDCSAFNDLSLTIPNCDGRIYIHISTKDDGCGALAITATDISGCNAADNCEDIGPANTMRPISDQGEVCLSSCLELSCNSTCTRQSVFFEVQTDAVATAMNITINNADFDPAISVRLIGNTCNDGADLESCLPVQNGTPVEVEVSQGVFYHIEVSVLNGEASPFDICVNTIQQNIDCATGNLRVFRQDFPGADSAGPYCPGETVTFCYDLQFDIDDRVSGNNCQWVQGIVPVLGGGWDLNADNLSDLDNVPNGWNYFPEGSVDFNVNHPSIARTIDPLGRMALEFGPGGLSPGDLLPAGWWVVSNGTGPDCTNDGDPDNGWGLDSPCDFTFNMTHCFQLTTRSVQSIQDCDDDFSRDLGIEVYVFADGQTGCYNNSTCTGDTPATFTAELDCSTLLDIVVADKEICSGEFVDMEITIAGGFEEAIEIEVMDAGNTSGAEDVTFERGNGILSDQIVNTSGTVQTVTYSATLSVPGSLCPVPTVFFDVTVEPQLEPAATAPLICEGTLSTLSSIGSFDAYEWFDLNNTLLGTDADVEVDEAGIYILQVTRGLCVEQVEVEVLSTPSLPFALLQEEVSLCNQDIGTLDTGVDLDQFIDPVVQGDWFNELGASVSSDVDFDGASTGPLVYQFTTTNAMSPCVDTTYNFTINIEECECPSIDIATIIDQCPSDQILNLNDFTTSTDLGTWVVTDGPDITSVMLVNGSLTIDENIVPGLYEFTYTLDGNNFGPLCIKEARTSFSIGQTSIAEIQPDITACNALDGISPSIIDLDDLFISGAEGIWSSDDFSIDSDNIISLIGENPGDYILQYETNEAIAPCSNEVYELRLTIIDCACEPLDLLPLDDQCQENINIELGELISDAGPGTWSIIAANAASVPIIENNARLVITEDTEADTYTLIYTLNNQSLPINCDSEATIVFDVIGKSFAEIGPQASVCNQFIGSDPDFIDLDDLFISGSSGIWSTTESSLSVDSDNVVSFAGQDVRDYILTYTTDDAQVPCQNISYDVVITVKDCSCPSLVLIGPLDLCQEVMTLALDELVVDAASGDWSMTAATGVVIPFINGDSLFIPQDVEVGSYELLYTLIDPVPSSCAMDDVVRINIAAAPSVEIIENVSVCNSDIGTLPVLFDLDTMVIAGSTGDWLFDTSVFAFTPNNEISTLDIPEGDYTFTYTTNDAVAPCENVSFDLVVSVASCACPPIQLTDIGDICQTEQIIDLNVFAVGADPGTWTSVNHAGLINPPVLDAALNTLTISDLSSPGDYTLTYRLDDPNLPTACMDETDVSLTIVAGVSVDLVSNIEVCNFDSGDFVTLVDLDTLIINGNVGSWTVDSALTLNANNIIDFTGVTPGNYTITYLTTDAVLPCPNESFDVNVIVNDCTCPLIGLNNAPMLCNSVDSFDLSTLVMSGVDAGTWSFVSGPETLDVVGDMISYNGVQEGIYTYAYTLNDPNLPATCPSSDEVEIMILAGVSVDIVSDLVVCNLDGGNFATFVDLDSLVLSGNAGDWTVDGAFTIDADNVVDFTGVIPGNYTITYSTNDAVFPCPNRLFDVNVIVTDCSCPFIGLGLGPELCNSDNTFDLSTLVLSGVGPGAWSFVSGPETLDVVGEIISYNGIQEGVYTYAYTLDETVSGPCEQFANVDVQIFSAPELVVTPDITVCNGDSPQAPVCIDLSTFSSTQDGVWSQPNNYSEDFSDISNICFDNVDAGLDFEFTFTTNNAQGPCADADGSIIVSVIDCNCPDLSLLSPDPLCSDAGVLDLSDLQTTTTVDGQWSFVDGPQQITLASDNVFDPQGMTAGLYTFMYTPDVMPVASCDQFVTIDIEVFTPLTAGVGRPTEYCENDNQVLDLFSMLLGADAGGSWMETSTVASQSGFNASVGTFNIEDEVPGTYEFSYEHIGSVACPATPSMVTIIITAAPIADAGVDSELNCSVDTVILGSDDLSNEFEYEWTDLSGIQVNNANSPNPTVTQAGTYIVRLTDTDLGCESFDTIVVINNVDMPTFEAEVLPVSCDGNVLGSLVISNSTGGDGNYSYSIDSGMTFTDESVIRDLDPGTYDIILQDGNGCQSTIEGLVIDAPINIGIDLGEDRTVEFGEIVTLSVSTIASANDISIVVWEEDGEIICEGGHNDCVTIDVDPDGVSTYCVTLSDNNGCEETSCIVLTEVINPNVYLANVFMPESSSFDNRFFVQSDDLIESVEKFLIFDRWGNKVFVAEEGHLPNDPKEGWDGIYKGQLAEAGVYTYLIEVMDVQGQLEKHVGSITVLK